jgi:YidC/Oxa1 family membrane protein insertase
MIDRTKLNYILFFVLSFLIIIGYTAFFAPKAPKKPPQQKTGQVSERTQTPEEKGTKAVGEILPPASTQGKLITIKTPLYTGVIDTAGGRIVEWSLEKYKSGSKKNSPSVDILSGSPPIFNTELEIKDIQIPNPIPFVFEGSSEINVSDKEKEIALEWKSPEGVEIKKIYEINPTSYLLGHRLEIKNTTETPLDETHLVQWYGKVGQDKSDKNYRNDKSFIAMIYNKVERVDKPPREGGATFKGTINWFGFADKYFISAFIPLIGAEARTHLVNVDLTSSPQVNSTTRQSVEVPQSDKGLVGATFDYPSDIIPPGKTLTYKSNLYLGPMDYEILRSVGFGLENSIKYGWVGPLARPLLWLLNKLYGLFKNYGIAIIAITIIVRAVFLPLTIKSMASMKQMQARMQELKPKIEALKEKYKDDKAAQNTELMKLYTSNGINPLGSLGGCLPLLVQFPVFIALYDVLLYSIELRYSSFLWIDDLSSPEHLFTIPGVGVPFRILPLVMGASWYLSQKMTPTTAPGTDNAQMKMMEFMPLIFTVMFWGLPSGLILYWTVSNILSIVQQLYVNQRFITSKGGIKDAGSNRKGRKNSV